MNIRIIAGRFGGRKITAPEGRTTHPMSERIRNALFNSLGDEVKGASVLDTFAGTGSVGIEALSRGASSVIFVERDRVASNILQENITTLGIGSETKAIRAGVGGWLANSRGAHFDLIFADPPYHDVQPATVRGLAALLTPGGQMVVSLPENYDETTLVSGRLSVTDVRIYGNAKLVKICLEA